MFKIMMMIAVVVLILHGLIHLMGMASYMKLATIQGLPYKTTLLGGRWDVGEAGISIYGALWGVAALGFVVTALACWFDWGWGLPALVGVTLFSLALTALDWNAAFAGVFVNIAILILIWLGPRITAAFPR